MSKIYLDVDELLNITNYWKEMINSFSTNLPTTDNINIFNILKESEFEFDSITKYNQDVNTLEECIENYHKAIFNYIDGMNDSNNYIDSNIPKFVIDNNTKKLVTTISSDYVGTDTKMKNVDANKLNIDDKLVSSSTYNSSYSNVQKDNLNNINNDLEQNIMKIKFIDKINARLLNKINNGNNIHMVTYVGNSTIIKKYMTNINRSYSGHFVSYKGNFKIYKRNLGSINNISEVRYEKYNRY